MISKGEFSDVEHLGDSRGPPSSHSCSAALWFSPPVFGKIWQRANGFGPDEPGEGWRRRGWLIAFLLTLVMSANLAMFLNDPKTTLAWGATAGFLAGFGWVLMGIGIVSMFEREPLVVRARERRLSHGWRWW